MPELASKTWLSRPSGQNTSTFVGRRPRLCHFRLVLGTEALTHRGQVQLGLFDPQNDCRPLISACLSFHACRDVPRSSVHTDRVRQAVGKDGHWKKALPFRAKVFRHNPPSSRQRWCNSPILLTESGYCVCCCRSLLTRNSS